MTKHICDKCGKELNSNTPFCPNCGAAVFHSDWDTPAPPPSAPPVDTRPEQDMTQPQAEAFPMIPKSRKWIPYAAVAIAAMIGLILSWDSLTALFSPAQDPQLSSGPSSSVAPSSTGATTSDTKPVIFPGPIVTTKPTEPIASTSPSATTAPTQPTLPEGIQFFQELLTQNQTSGMRNFYNIATLSTFSDPKEINMWEILCNGIFRTGNHKLTDEELEYFTAIDPNYAFVDVYRMEPEEIDAMLTLYFDITLEEVNKAGKKNLTYWEETDCYYAFCTDLHWNSSITVIDCQPGEDSTIQVIYNTMNDGCNNYMMTLREVNGFYRILSNLPITPISEPIPVKDSDEIDEECARIATKAYFTQRLAFLRGESDQLPMAYELITPDLAKHREAIQAKSCTLLFSYVSVYKVNSWELAEVYATETCGYLINGQYKIFVIPHYLLISRTSSNLPVVSSDGYWDTAVNFESCSYVPPEYLTN